jgi:hypothetical protein
LQGVEPNSLMRSVARLAQRGQVTTVARHSCFGLDPAS